MIHYTIQGFRLHQPSIGFQLMEGSSFAPEVSPRRVDFYIPRQNGQLPLWDDELSAQKLALRVRITDTDPEQLQSKWEHLRGLMWVGSNRGLTIRRESGTQVTSCFAQIETMSEPDFWCASGIVDTMMIFNIPYGRWQSVQTYEEELNSNQEDQQLDFVNNSTAPLNDVLFRFQGPAGTPWAAEVWDKTTQTGFSLSGMQGLNSNQYVIVDPLTQRAFRNGTDSSWEARDQNISQFMSPILGGMLQLVSIPGFQLGNRTSNVSTWTNAAGISLMAQGRRNYI